MSELASSDGLTAEEEQAKDTTVMDFSSVDHVAPPGWKKQIITKKAGTPGWKEVVFFSPTGEEVRSRRQLDQFLKAHPGGPSPSDFDWATGETPRRSARISEKAKVSSSEKPEVEPHRKRGRKSRPKKADSQAHSGGAGDSALAKDAGKEQEITSKEVVKEAEDKPETPALLTEMEETAAPATAVMATLPMEATEKTTEDPATPPVREEKASQGPAVSPERDEKVDSRDPPSTLKQADPPAVHC
ncbi:uncharacterized protein LOC144712340 [Wolffia australiana]